MSYDGRAKCDFCTPVFWVKMSVGSVVLLYVENVHIKILTPFVSA